MDKPCPVCGTRDWSYWDVLTGSGKCANKHMVDTNTDGSLYCSATYATTGRQCAEVDAHPDWGEVQCQLEASHLSGGDPHWTELSDGTEHEWPVPNVEVDQDLELLAQGVPIDLIGRAGSVVEVEKLYGDDRILRIDRVVDVDGERSGRFLLEGWDG